MPMWTCKYNPDRGEWQLCQGRSPYLVDHCTTDEDRPFAHPVAVGANSDVLTALRPADHPWHMGFWFSWKFLNDVNYWEDNATGHPDGQVRMSGSTQLTVDPDSPVAWVELTSDYTYHPHGRERAVADERRFRRYYRPQGSRHWLDYGIVFTAHEPVTIDRTPITDKTPWGGYAGLSWRFNENLTDVHGFDAQGRTDLEIEHQSAPWAAMYGRLQGRTVGIAMMDHPDNPRHPTAWRYIADPGFSYLNPSPVLNEPLRLASGQVLRLRYRVVIYEGQPDADDLASMYHAFAEGR